ncbi:major facilitator superfamily [Lactarius tabidus]
MPDHDKEKDQSVDVASASIEGELSSVGGIAKMRIWRKLDIHLLPLLTLLFFLSSLDRTIIGKPFLFNSSCDESLTNSSETGYAKIAGMTEDLHLTGLRYNITAALFYIPFCLVEVPSNILLRVFSPSRWIPSIMIGWGTVTTLMCLVNSYRGLAITRFFLGLAEGGLFPGLAYYVSLWYPRQFQAKRIALFNSTATICAAFGGIFAYGIEHLDGKAGLHGWQWIFFVEGLSVLAIRHGLSGILTSSQQPSLSPAYLISSSMTLCPETAKFLTEEERQFIIQTLADDSNGQATHFSPKFVWQALADWKTYPHALMYMCAAISSIAVSLFAPTIVHDLGFSANKAQLLSAPIFCLGGISTYIVGIWSDSVKLRGPFIAGCALVSMIGYIIAYTTSEPGPGYAAAIIVACGSFPSPIISVAWAGGNAGGNVKRAIVLGLVIGLGNLGGICSSFVYYQPPRFHKGHATMIGFLGTGCFMMWTYRRLNKEKEELCAREGINESMKDMYRDLANKSPLFRAGNRLSCLPSKCPRLRRSELAPPLVSSSGTPLTPKPTAYGSPPRPSPPHSFPVKRLGRNPLRALPLGNHSALPPPWQFSLPS